jgi:hypothetical protein
MNHPVWTDAKIAIVRRLYPTEKSAALAKELGVTVGALNQKANMIGVRKAGKYGQPPAADHKTTATYSPRPGVTVHRLLG